MTSRYPFELFGVEHGPGWNQLTQPLLKVANLAGIQILQVKEKFGTLRVYHAGPDWFETLTQFAEHLSAQTCEDCGAKRWGWFFSTAEQERGKTVRTRTDGWHRTLCDPCAGDDRVKEDDHAGDR